jgi:hypothetical protein
VVVTGQPVEFAIIHVGLPSPPNVVLKIDGGTITVAEAAVTMEIDLSGI